MPRLRVLSAALLLLLVAGILAACGGGAAAYPTSAPAAEPTAAPAASPPTSAPAAEPTSAPAAAASGGTLVVGRTAAPDSLNPCVAYLAEAYDVSLMVYDALITTDLRGKAQPQLAKEWSVGPDGKTWTFKLYPGAKWHDGQPVTADDVVFTYKAIQGYDSCSTIKPYTSKISAIEAPDPATVKITFEQPVANAEERFAGVYILPKHIWEKFKTTDEMTAFEDTEMIGSGPFKMAEYKPGEFTRLKAVKDHYQAPPKIDEVIFKVYKNADSLVQALKTGEVDLITDPPTTLIRALQSEQNIKVEIGKARRLTDIIFNVTDPKNCPKDGGKCTGHPALRDVRVRQALAHATDKQALIDTVLLGLGSPGLTLVTIGHGDWFDTQIQDYAFDVEKAKQILEDAGYKDTDGDGIREMPGDPKKPLKFRYSFPSDQEAADGQRFYELLRDMWKQAGVELNLQSMEADALTAACCPAFDTDVFQWGWFATADPASLLNITTTGEIPSGTSESGYSNPEYDKLYDEQGVTVDPAKRKELINKMQEILMRDVPYIIPYYRQASEAYRTDRFQGWNIDPEGILQLVDRSSLTVITPVK
jgi:peptide/nickel transport system substrate-binding protein